MMSPPETPSPIQSPATPLGLQNLDAAAAIALMDNSVELYQTIAHAFLLELTDLLPQLTTLLQQGELPEATRTLHTFKGLSLTVGANMLSSTCRQFELMFKSLLQEGRSLDDVGRDRALAELGLAIVQTREALCAELTPHDAGATPSHAAPSACLDAPALLTELQKLRPLLQRSNLKALDVHADLCAKHPAVHEAQLLLSEAIRIFDFPQAVVQCDQLIRYFSDPN